MVKHEWHMLCPRFQNGNGNGNGNGLAEALLIICRGTTENMHIPDSSKYTIGISLLVPLTDVFSVLSNAATGGIES
jgi:hypothetical protein